MSANFLARIWHALVLVLFLTLCAPYARSQAQPVEISLPACSGSLQQYAVCEIKLTPGHSYTDLQAYTQMDVTATFTNNITGTTKLVHGFYDRLPVSNQLVFKVRFNASEQGAWKYTTNCSSAAVNCSATGDAALNVVSQDPAFTVGSSSDPGFLRRDATYREKLSFENAAYTNSLNASPYPFVWGQTYYHLITNDIAGGGWQAAVLNSKARRMNKVRMLLYPWWDYLPYHDSQPFQGAASTPDHNRLNLPHWQHFDEVVKFLYDNKDPANQSIRDSILAEIIIFKDPATQNQVPIDNNRTFSSTYDPATNPVPVEDQRYMKYAIARYAAFPNVVWSLSNEWQKTNRPSTYWTTMGSILTTKPTDAPNPYDPWMFFGTTTTRPRASSIHGATDQSFQFPNQLWAAHAVIQFGTNNNPPVCLKCGSAVSFSCQQGDDWGYFGITYNIFRSDTCARRQKPVSNDEYGYIGDPKTTVGVFDRNKHRRAIWGIAMAGGYGSAGDLTPDPNSSNATPTISANWLQQNAYSDIRTMADFFTKNVTRWWEMTTPVDLSTIVASSSTGRVYALARTAPAPNPQYVVYAAGGGTFTIKLPQGNYSAYFFDPRLAAQSGATQTFNIDGVTKTSQFFTAPDANDWVLLITQQ
jgi:hypothetical protein